MMKSKLMRNVNYHYSSDRYASSFTLRFKSLYFSLRRNKVTKTWHHCVKFIHDLDILGLYHEVGCNIKNKNEKCKIT
jgi:hypothetical protein